MNDPLIVFLPCRKGSERVKNKNIRRFSIYEHGLLEIKLRQLLDIRRIKQIVLSTNDEEILQYAGNLGSDRIILDRRREELCLSSTSTDELINYVPEIIPEGHVLWTHVTSPFISAKDYDNAIESYEKSLEDGFDSLMSVTRVQKFLFDESGNAVNFNRDKEKWPRTQTIDPYFEANSGYFLSSISNYRKFSDRIGAKVSMKEIDSLQSFDIDWEEDFVLAERIYNAINGL
ncbi:cytidylyltransferase domain-containing protein [Fulvivirga sedimenti]|uniref:Acylneuraminate cytidylyltransferase family protein n=1 Tax=Fulvivirga sedimenti TaxID=2879465 RepID=A0A9X1KYB4_9BACT|nr:acylneuraminate cytidylyltransferase family protein [Fulvivirga sedimenti]MCA6073426.1 acylneuraminate cytidylyltransferase family protein [Fulvivirga sedimenti]